MNEYDKLTIRELKEIIKDLPDWYTVDLLSAYSEIHITKNDVNVSNRDSSLSISLGTFCDNCDEIKEDSFREEMCYGCDLAGNACENAYNCDKFEAM